jgi:hypothetical protein
MNVTFLKDISEAYVMDSDLEVDPNQIYEQLYDVVKFLQSYDLELYNELYEGTKLQQQRILKNYLDITYESELITEDAVVIPISVGTLLAGIATVIFGKSAAKLVNKTLALLGESFETLGKWLARHGKYSQIRYAITHQNTQACYRKCGIQKPSDIKFLTNVTATGSSFIGGEKSIEQGKCLRECYVTELIDVIALHMENYFACLKRTGSFDVVQKTDSDDIMKMVSSTNVAAACESYYNAAREALDNFYRFIELIYDDRLEADKRLEKINLLRNKIYEARQTIQKTNENQIQRYGQQPFRPPQQSQKPFRPPQQNTNNPNFRRN